MIEMTKIRHRFFHQNIVDNFKGEVEELRGIDDELLYWMIASWEISEDYPDVGFIVQHQQTAIEDMTSAYQYYTDQMIYGDDAYQASIQRWNDARKTR